MGTRLRALTTSLALVLLASLAVGCRGDATAADKSKNESESAEPIRLLVDGTLIVEVAPSSLAGPTDLGALLGAKGPKREQWVRIDALGDDGQRSMLPGAGQQPKIRAVVEPSKKGGPARFSLVRASGSLLSTVPKVRSIEITTTEAPPVPSKAPPDPSLELVIGNDTTIFVWLAIEPLGTVRPKGYKRAGVPLAKLLAPKVELATVARVEVRGTDDQKHEFDGSLLTSSEQHVFLRRNNSGLLRFGHLAPATNPGKKSRYSESGKVRGVQSIHVFLR